MRALASSDVCRISLSRPMLKGYVPKIAAIAAVGSTTSPNAAIMSAYKDEGKKRREVE